MTAPDPAALLAAMEAAAHNMQPKYMLMTIRPDDLAALCAALRASQEREAAAVEALEDVAACKPGRGSLYAHAVLANIRARKDAAP
jgi:hypothetical protein